MSAAEWSRTNQGVCLVPHIALNYFALCVTDSFKWVGEKWEESKPKASTVTTSLTQRISFPCENDYSCTGLH